MTNKKYGYIRVYKETKDAFDNRLKYINENDLKFLGCKKKISRTKFLDYLSKRKLLISDFELKSLAKNKLSLKQR